ncbi:MULTISPECIES: response regulator [unclassified Leptolyngbya]|uniref:response regulator n=1 Tax=unclassified Leptolyngbya TaxID=2650499 RepID=UPI0016828E95|nr:MULTISPECIES: response regulator [unclassified Leptolyngbya]MBD1909726.1 response regulator [Leptolyngbya sp. FACHB-8]
MRKILIIDENSVFRLLLADFLSFQGFNVMTAESGQDGLDIAQKHHPDMVFCDVDMPGMTGFEILDRIRSDQQTANISFFFLTAEPKIEKQVWRRANGFLKKPIDFDELNQILVT